MDSTTITRAFTEEELERKDVEEFLREENRGRITDDDLAHVADCFMSIYRFHHGGYPPGSFVSALIRNDFLGAVGRADRTNQKHLDLYGILLHNCIPARVLEDLKERLEEEEITL